MALNFEEYLTLPAEEQATKQHLKMVQTEVSLASQLADFLAEHCDEIRIVKRGAKAEVEALGPVLGADLETMPLIEHPRAGLVPTLSRIRVATLFDRDKRICLLIDCNDAGFDWLEALRSKTLIFHNAAFDLGHLWHVRETQFDFECTMLADRALEGVNRSLAQLAAEMLDLTISKALQVSDWSRPTLLPEQVHYAAADAVIAGVVWPQLEEWLEDPAAYRYFKDLVYPVIRQAPISVYVAAHGAWVASLEDTIARESAELAKVGLTNPNSTKQKQDYLEEHLEPLQTIDWPLTKGGALSTGREDLLAASWMPEMGSLARYAEAAHLNSNFGAKLQTIMHEGKLYPDFRIGGAASGRFTSSNPNAQNLPRSGFKDMIIAGDGQSFVCADYSQIELRVLAEFSREPVMLAAYRDGRDLHSAIGNEGAALIGTDSPRQLGKVLNFGLAYGGGAGMLTKFAWSSYGVHLTIDQAVELKDMWMDFYPDLADWQRETIDSVRAWGETKTRHFRITNEQPADCWSTALNYPVQGTAAEILGLALVGVDRELRDGWRIAAHVHDEILLVGPTDTADKAKVMLEDQMHVAFSTVLPDAPTRDLVEAGIGSTWKGAKV